MTPRPPIADLLDAVKRLPVSLRIENGLREGVLSINDARAIETLRRYLPDYLNAHDDLVEALDALVEAVDLAPAPTADSYWLRGKAHDSWQQAASLLRALDAPAGSGHCIHGINPDRDCARCGEGQS